VTETVDLSQRPSFRTVAVLVVWSLIALQVALWFAVLILRMNSIEVVVGSIGGNQLQMTLFWTSIGCFIVLIFGAEVSYARDHRGAGIVLMALTAVGTVVLSYVALIAIGITAYQSFTHFTLERSGDTYVIDTSRILIEGGGPSVSVYRTHGPFYDRREPLAEDRMSSGWSPFPEGDYYVFEKGGEVTIRYGSLPGDHKDSEMTFTAER